MSSIGSTGHVTDNYLTDPGLRREIHQEISMLALHLLQSALVLVNTRLVDRVLAEPEWAGRLTEHDLRGLTPLFWSNDALYLDNGRTISVLGVALS